MKKYIILAALVVLGACANVEKKAEYPVDPEERRKFRAGKLTGDKGIVLFGKGSDSKSGGGVSGIGVNSYLWRATLDTLSFMPLASADPFGGVIITDWYEDPKSRGERFKVNAVILDSELRSNAIKISVFKQKKGDKSDWQDATVKADIVRKLEDKVLTRARQLRVAKEKSS